MSDSEIQLELEALADNTPRMSGFLESVTRGFQTEFPSRDITKLRTPDMLSNTEEKSDALMGVIIALASSSVLEIALRIIGAQLKRFQEFEVGLKVDGEERFCLRGKGLTDEKVIAELGKLLEASTKGSVTAQVRQSAAGSN